MEAVMKKQITIVALLIFAIAGVSGNAFAWGHGQGHGRGSCQGFDNTRGAWSDLSEDQKTKLTALHQKFIDETAETRTGISSKHDEMRILMETSAPDKARLLKIGNELADLKKVMMEKQITFALEAKKIAPNFDFPAGCMGAGKRCGMGGMGMGPKGQGKSNQMSNAINQ